MKNISSFQKAVFISFIFSGIGSILNYLYQIILGNMLTIEEFGVFNSINSLAANVVIIFTPLSIMICQTTALNRETIEKNSGVYRKVLKISLGLAFIICISGLITFNTVNGKFGADSLLNWLIILIMIGVSGQHAIVNGVIQGLERFVLYGSMGAILILIKMILSIINIKVGLGIQGIVWAMLVSYACVIVIVSLKLRKTIFLQDNYSEYGPDKREIIRLYGITFFVQILVSFYINGGEIMLMGYLFDNRQIGLYSAAATLGKISLYMISIISIVLFPRVANRSNKGLGTSSIFYKTVFISIILSVAYAIFLLAIGKKLIPIMFGNEYEVAVEYIDYVVVFAVPVSTLSIIHNYFLGIGKTKEYAKVLGGVTAAIILVIIMFIDNVRCVPVILGIGLTLVIIWSCLYIKRINIES